MTSDWFCGVKLADQLSGDLSFMLVTRVYSSVRECGILNFCSWGQTKYLVAFSWVCSSRGNHHSSAITAAVDALVGTCSINLQNWNWTFSISSD